MKNAGGFFTALLAIAAGILYVNRASADSNYITDSYGNIVTDSYGNPVVSDSYQGNAMPDTTGFTAEQRLNAFLKMIRQFESNDDYYVIYGGSHFTDDSRHPYDGKPLPAHSASGAYQFVIKTWKVLKNRLGLHDFSPQSQDIAAVELLREIGALSAIQNDDIDLALRKASTQWASLPYSNAGQNPKSINVAMDYYNNSLGVA